MQLLPPIKEKPALYYRLFSGRIGRLGFMLGTLYYLLATLVALFILATLLVAILTTHNHQLTQAQLVGPVRVLVIIWLIGFAALVLSVCTRRLHDVDRPGLLAVLALVPFANVAFIAYLLVAPGNPENNSYGEPTLHNGLWDTTWPGAKTAKKTKKDKKSD